MTFGVAIGLIKAGIKVARQGWNGKGMYIALRNVGNKEADYTYKHDRECSMIRRPYIYMKTVNDELVPWVASQTDILADDWVSVD